MQYPTMKLNTGAVTKAQEERDGIYFTFLRFAAASNLEHFKSEPKHNLINLINFFPKYHRLLSRLTPIILSHIQKLGLFNDLTLETQAMLKKETQNGIIKQLAKQAQVDLIIQWCNAAQVPILLLKGCAFQQTLYHHYAPRLSSDIDILVRKQDWAIVLNIFETNMKYVNKAQPSVLGNLYELSFIPNGNFGDAVDLHKSLSYPILFNIDDQDLWENSQIHPQYNSEYVLQLSPEYSLLHQAIHAYVDMDFLKYNLVDSHRIINIHTVKWSELLAITHKSGAQNIVYQLLKNLTTIMETQVPDWVLAQLKPKQFNLWLSDKLLQTSQVTLCKKPFTYRLQQVINQYVFTGSIIRPLKFQWFFITTALLQKFGIRLRYAKYV